MRENFPFEMCVSLWCCSTKIIMRIIQWIRCLGYWGKKMKSLICILCHIANICAMAIELNDSTLHSFYSATRHYCPRFRVRRWCEWQFIDFIIIHYLSILIRVVSVFDISHHINWRTRARYSSFISLWIIGITQIYRPQMHRFYYDIHWKACATFPSQTKIKMRICCFDNLTNRWTGAINIDMSS